MCPQEIQRVLSNTFPNPTTIHQNNPMRNLPVSILVTLAVLLGSAGESIALPECPGTYNANTWTNCIGTLTGAGHKYVGQWKGGERHGQGTTYYRNGGKYIGEYKDGKIHGQGTLTYASGNKYVGEWKDGKGHGQGTFTFANGDKYVGEFKDSKTHGQGTYTDAKGRVKEGIWENNEFQYAQKITPTVTAKKPPGPSSEVQNENERLRRENARLKKQNQSKPKQVAKRTPPKKSPPPKTGTSGSGFFVSKSGHVITNEHVIRDCSSVTVGDNAKKQVTVTIVEKDKRNDLALLKISSTKMTTADTKSLISKLGITIVPLESDGLLRSEDAELGERVLVAGYPYGDIFSNTIKVTGGMVSANRGFGDDTGQFQMDAAVQPGNSGGPIYDENGNIVGVVVSQLNKMKFAKATGSMPENVNFGIKASTVRQFLNSAGLPTKWSKRSKRMSTKQLAKIAKNQTVMVVCNP